MCIDLLGFVPRREALSAGGRRLAAGRPHRSRARRAVAGLAVLLVLSAVGSAMAQGRRLALVVGNDAYRAQSALRNAVNDARAVASALDEVGFAVTRVENANRARLTSALSSFAGSLRGDDVALFYFAGHGVQVDGVNYLMPTDYAGQSSSALRFDAVSASDVQEMLGRARVAMLVFDACRNNPYRGVRGGTGLAPMEARGTLVAYAAGAGEVAADSAPGASNGLFTSKFVEALRAPGLTATDLFRRVRRQVYEASNAEQWPAVYDDLLSDFVFRPAVTAGVAPTVAAPAGATPASEAALGLDRAARRRIQRGLAEAGFDPGPADGVFGPGTRTAIRGWQASRGAIPTGYLDGPASAALGAPAGSAASAGAGRPASTLLQQEAVFWQSIQGSTNPADFEAYLQQYPTGAYRALAMNRLTVLLAPVSGALAAPAAASGPPPVGIPAGHEPTDPPVSRPPAVDVSVPTAFLFDFDRQASRNLLSRCPELRIAHSVSVANLLIFDLPGSGIAVYGARGNWHFSTTATRESSRMDDVCEALPEHMLPTVQEALPKGGGEPASRDARIPVVFLIRGPVLPLYGEPGFTHREVQDFDRQCSKVRVTPHLGRAGFIMMNPTGNNVVGYDMSGNSGSRVGVFRAWRRSNIFKDMCAHF